MSKTLRQKVVEYALSFDGPFTCEMVRERMIDGDYKNTPSTSSIANIMRSSKRFENAGKKIVNLGNGNARHPMQYKVI